MKFFSNLDLVILLRVFEITKIGEKNKYIYNDIDRLLTNYAEVVASNSMHQKLIDKIIKLQNFSDA